MTEWQSGGPFRGRVVRAIEYLFPERQVVIRTEGRVAYIRVARWVQMTAAAGTLVLAGWAAFTSFEYVLHDKLLAAKDNDIAQARLAYRSLLNEVADYQKKFTIITADLEENHSLMLNLVEQNSTLQQNLKTVETELASTKEQQVAVMEIRERLKSQLHGIEHKMRTMATRNFSLKDSLTTIETDLQTALSERNEALYQASRMRQHVGRLETQLAELQDTNQDTIQRLASRTATYIETFERVVDMAGLDVGNLVGTDQVGQGGPFIAARAGEDGDELPASELKATLAVLGARLDYWESLQDVMRRIPLTAPLKYFHVTSRFGKRKDPINGKWAAHYGLDLGAANKSQVYAPAPGKVTFAGWKGRYGNLIEIDHGGGLKTRYGHLARLDVKKGDTVEFYQKIALVGSTGRSTGPHLHYEVVFNGKSKDPMKFIRAGRYVFQE